MRITDIIALAALVTTILITVIIAGNLQTVATTMDLGAEGNATRSTLFANTWSALTLASIGLVIAAAVGILALIMGALAPRGQTGIA